MGLFEAHLLHAGKRSCFYDGQVFFRQEDWKNHHSLSALIFSSRVNSLITVHAYYKFPICYHLLFFFSGSWIKKLINNV